MADATVTPTAPTQATPAAPEVAGKPAPGTPEMAAYWAKQAAKAKLADDTAAADGLAAARAEGEPKTVESTAVEPTGRERGRDGKFKPKGKTADGKQAAKAPVEETSDAGDAGESGGDDASAEPAELEGRTEVPVPGGLSAARKLVRDGDIAKALELIGLHPDKLESKQWGAFRQREKAAVERERSAVAKEEQLKSIARELNQKYSNFEQARAAYEAEDWDEAFKLAFNEDANAYQRKRVSAMTTKDPKVAQLEKELRALKAQREEDTRKQAEQHTEAERQQARAAHKVNLSKEMADCGDPRFERAAKKPAFIQKIFDIQERNFDGRTTLDAIEAAEQAWEELYEGVAGESSPTTAVPVSKPAGTAKTPVRQAAKAATTLNPHEAAEAAPAPKLEPGSKELRDYYARKAELAMLNGEAG
jgi:hypothetical protein